MEKKTELVCWLEKKSQIMDFLYDGKISPMFQGIHPLDQNPREFLNQVVAVEVDVWAEIGGDDHHHHHHHHHHHGGGCLGGWKVAELGQGSSSRPRIQLLSDGSYCHYRSCRERHQCLSVPPDQQGPSHHGLCVQASH